MDMGLYFRWQTEQEQQAVFFTMQRNAAAHHHSRDSAINLKANAFTTPLKKSRCTFFSIEWDYFKYICLFGAKLS